MCKIFVVKWLRTEHNECTVWPIATSSRLLRFFFIGVQISLLFSFYLNLFVYKFMINQWRNLTSQSTWWTWCPQHCSLSATVLVAIDVVLLVCSFSYEMATTVVCQRWPHESIMRWRLIWATLIGKLNTTFNDRDFDNLLFFASYISVMNELLKTPVGKKGFHVVDLDVRKKHEAIEFNYPFVRFFATY